MNLYELEHRGLLTTRQQPIPLDGAHIEVGFLADLIVEGLVIVEIRRSSRSRWLRRCTRSSF